MSVDTVARESRDLPLDVLDPPQLDARLERDPEQLVELTRDIQKRGVILPLVVVRTGARYEIVDGFTRYLCAKRAGIAVVPCSIYPSKDDALEGVKYALNIFRLDMSPAEEAVMMGQLFEHECGHDIDRLCGLVNKSLSYVNSRLLLLNGATDVFEAVKTKQIGLGVAEELNKIPDAHYRAHYLHHAMRDGATRGVVAGWVTEWKQLFGGTALPQPPVAVSEPGLADDVEHPFTCVVCGKHDKVHMIRQINIHQHCKMAILDPLLENARGHS